MVWRRVGLSGEAAWGVFRIFLNLLGASYRRLGRGLEACWAVWEASWGCFRISFRFLKAFFRFSCGLEAGWMRFGRILEALSKHFGGVLGRRQSVFLVLEAILQSLAIFDTFS